MTRRRSVGITGLGKCLPRTKVTSAQLARRLAVSESWILDRTGIRSRYYLARGESVSQLSARAARIALRRAGIRACDVGWVIGCTFCGDHVFPGLASRVQELVGARGAGAFDLSAGSVGFLVALTLAADRLRCDPGLKHVLVVAGAAPSRYLDWDNPNVSVLFGDGAGAAVVSAVPGRYGLLATELLSRGEAYDAVSLPAGGSGCAWGADRGKHVLQSIQMDGTRVGREFLKHQPPTIRRVLKEAGYPLSEVDLFVFHQANLRLLRFLMAKLGVPERKTYLNVQRVGNTADASLAIALCEAWEAGLVRRGRIVLLSGVGPGFVFGATVLRWHSG